jgi:type IV secretory pathway VirB3-like protein
MFGGCSPSAGVLGVIQVVGRTVPGSVIGISEIFGEGLYGMCMLYVCIATHACMLWKLHAKTYLVANLLSDKPHMQAVRRAARAHELLHCRSTVYLVVRCSGA